MLRSLDWLSRYFAPRNTGEGGGGSPAPDSSGSTSAPAGGSEPASGGSSSPAVPLPTSSVGSDTPSDYGFLDDIFGAQGQGAPKSTSPATPTPSPTPAAVAQPQAPPTVAQQPQAPSDPAQAAPPVQATAQAQPDQGTQGPQASFDPADPVSLARGLVANYDAAVNHLASGPFALSPQDMEALETDVAGTVPKLLARAAVYMQTQVLTQMGRIIPQMIQRHGEVTKVHGQHVDAFYSAWPSIDKAKHAALVNEMGWKFRQLNPDMPTEQMIEALGPFILARLGLPQVAMTRAAAAAPRPQRATNGQTTHFQPAAPGAVTVQQTEVQDPFGYMGQSG